MFSQSNNRTIISKASSWFLFMACQSSSVLKVWYFLRTHKIQDIAMFIAALLTKIFQIRKKSHMEQNLEKWNTITQGSLPRGIPWDLLNFLSMNAYKMMSTRKLVIKSTHIDFGKNVPWDQLLPHKDKISRFIENKQVYKVCCQLRQGQTQWETHIMLI